MIALYFFTIIAVVAIIIFVSILLFGIKVIGYVDLNSLCACVDILIFNRYYIAKIKLFECKQKFYYQINSKNIKEIKIKDKKSSERVKQGAQNEKNRDIENSESVKESAQVEKINKLKLKYKKAKKSVLSVKLKKLTINTAYGEDDIAKSAIKNGILNILTDISHVVLCKYIHCNDINMQSYMIDKSNFHINFEAESGRYFPQILYKYMHIITLKRRLNKYNG